MRGSAVAGVAVAAVVRNEREKSTKECMYIYVCVCGMGIEGTRMKRLTDGRCVVVCVCVCVCSVYVLVCWSQLKLQPHHRC